MYRLTSVAAHRARYSSENVDRDKGIPDILVLSLVLVAVHGRLS